MFEEVFVVGREGKPRRGREVPRERQVVPFVSQSWKQQGYDG